MVTDKKRILLAESDDVFAEAETAALESCGYVVHRVAAADDAAAALRPSGTAVDLVLAGFELGCALARLPEARRLLSEASVPVVFMLSGSDSVTAEVVSALGPFSVVAKDAGVDARAAAIEAALGLSEDRRAVERQRRVLRDMGSRAKLGTWEYDASSSTFAWSDALYQIFEVPPTTPTTLARVSELLTGEASERLRNAIERAIGRSSPFHLDCEITTPTGKQKWIRMQGQADDSPDPTTTLFGLLQDVSDIRLFNQVKQEAELTLNQIEAITHVGHWSVNVVDGSFYHSDETKRIFGYEPSEYALTVEDAIEAYHPDDREEVIRLFNRAVETGEGYEFDLRITQPGGAIRHVHSKGYTEKNADGQVVRVYGVFQDITSRKELEARLHQSEKMHAIGQLAGGVAHDFNNQLAGMMSFAELALQELDDSSASFTYISSVVSEITRAADLTRQLLAFARKGKYRVEPVDMNRVLADVVSIAKHSFDKKIRVTLRADASPATVAGDRSQLHNTVLNMALNSRDAMPDGGELVFSTDLVTLDHDAVTNAALDLEPGEHVRVTLRDTGVGMNMETQRHVFEPFFTTKSPGSGVGMGLASAYGTVQNHQGAIEIQSTPGEGTAITLYLPTHRAEVHDEQQPVSCQGAPSGRILVVDDEQMIANAMKILLGKAGYEVTTCANGRIALEVFERAWESIDLVILDMNMPEMNGEETFHAMKQVDPDVKVLLLSGYSLTNGTRSLLEAGAAGFFSKPVSSVELFAAISEVLGEQNS